MADRNRPRQKAENLVWDTNELDWVAMEQPTLESDSITVELPNEGQQTMANSISVTIASNQSDIPVSGTFFQATQPVSGPLTDSELRASAVDVAIESASSSAVTSVNDNSSNVTLLSANSDRKGATIFNDSSATLYVKFGTTATTTDYTVKLVQNAYYEVPFGYTGRIDGIWASDPGDGAARITELE